MKDPFTHLSLFLMNRPVQQTKINSFHPSSLHKHRSSAGQMDRAAVRAQPDRGGRLSVTSPCSRWPSAIICIVFPPLSLNRTKQEQKHEGQRLIGWPANSRLSYFFRTSVSGLCHVHVHVPQRTRLQSCSDCWRVVEVEAKSVAGQASPL